MLAAEESGNFVPSELSRANNLVGETSDVLANRLQDLEIKPTGTTTTTATSRMVTEKSGKGPSTARPLTMDEDDLEMDLELDENIDTTVGSH